MEYDEAFVKVDANTRFFKNELIQGIQIQSCYIFICVVVGLVIYLYVVYYDLYDYFTLIHTSMTNIRGLTCVMMIKLQSTKEKKTHYNVTCSTILVGDVEIILFNIHH